LRDVRVPALNVVLLEKLDVPNYVIQPDEMDWFSLYRKTKHPM
jgi:hypothetical protein